MLLYSSRANPHASTDIFSDYGILLAVTDVRRLHQDDHWLQDFGKVLVVFRNPISLDSAFECLGFITYYETGVKIDIKPLLSHLRPTPHPNPLSKSITS